MHKEMTDDSATFCRLSFKSTYTYFRHCYNGLHRVGLFPYASDKPAENFVVITGMYVTFDIEQATATVGLSYVHTYTYTTSDR